MNITRLIDRLAAAESAFLQARFLAPVTGQGFVQVRIAGAICRMRIRPARFAGWGIFQPSSHTLAHLEREATMTERRTYLALFPPIRLILISRAGPSWTAVPAELGDVRFTIQGEAIVHAVEDTDVLDTIIARFDGQRFWFDEVDPQADPSHAAYLSDAIVRMIDPRQITRPALTPEQRIAYAALHAERTRRHQQSARATGEQRLRIAVQHAGAEMRGFTELPDSYRVTYTVDGRHHTSVVRKNDLSIQSAGICLSGMDAVFDLTSLIGVLRRATKQAVCAMVWKFEVQR